MTSAQFANELKKETGDFEIHISSGGGSVFQGISIYNQIKAYNRGKVTVIITSLAASMASYIALAGDVVKAYDNAVFMIHNASVFAMGDHRELRKKADILEGLSGITAKRYASKTGKSDREIKKLMDDETFFYGEEIKSAGFVDEIVPDGKEVPKSQAVALANETFNACLKASSERGTDAEFEQASALLKTFDSENMEEPKPVKEGVQPEERVFEKNTLKVNAMKARLSLYKKGNK
jgi:ATP-dependent protease ClpP protease subunit